MIHLITLFLFTALIIFLAAKTWKQSGNYSLMIGTFLFYYWTLAGSWFIIIDNMTNRFFEKFGAHYYYLFDRLFTIHNDEHYLWSIIYYGTFIVVMQTALLLYLKKNAKLLAEEPVDPPKGMLVSWKLILMSVAAVCASFFFVHKQIFYAFATEQSVYTITRTYTDRFTSLHQLSNMVAVIPVYVGFLTLLTDQHSRFFHETRTRKKLIAYVIAIIFVEGYLTFLGNKHEILFGSILGVLLFLKNYKGRINWKPVLIFLVIAGTPLVFNDVLRGFSPQVIFKSMVKKVTPLEDQGMQKQEPSPDISVSSTTTSFLFSNEMFSAHFSMYGVQKYDVPPTYGSSFVYLAGSMIPRAIKPDRSPDIYTYYAEKVNAFKGQGFTINHATGWYLNFGLAGLILGATLLGLFWGFLIRKGEDYYKSSNRFLQILWFIASITFVAKIPVIIRGGPEAYKALIFEGMLLPALVILVCVSFKKQGKK